MRRSIAVMVAVISVGMSSSVFADDMGLARLSGEMKPELSGLSEGMTAQKTDLTNDLKAKKESVKNEMKTKRDRAKAKKQQVKADVRAKTKAKKEAAHARGVKLKGIAEDTSLEADRMNHDLKNAVRN
jgi:hypothetical protein